MKPLSISSAPRIRPDRCTYWLRADVAWTKDEGSQAADQGTARHDMIEALMEGKTPAHSPVIGWTEAEMQEAIGHAKAAGMHTTSMRAEVAYAVNFFTGETLELGEKIDRNYMPYLVQALAERDGDRQGFARAKKALKELTKEQIEALTDEEFEDTFGVTRESLIRWVPGSADYVDDFGGEIMDLKTGQLDNVDPARHNWQLLALLYAATGGKGGKIRIVHMRENGELHSSGRWIAEISEREMEEFREKVVTRLQMVPTSKPVPNSKCTYCPARQHCPAMGDLAKEAVAGIPREHLSLQIAGDDHASDLLKMKKALEAYAKEAGKVLNAYVDVSGPFEHEGKRYQQQTQSRKAVVLTDVSRRILAEENVPVEVVEKVKNSSIRRKAIWEKLDEAGCLSKSTYTLYKVSLWHAQSTR